MSDGIAAFLADRDTACPGCSYNLRDLTGSRCPECGQELVLTVGLAEPKLGLWIGGLVGLACGLGLFGFIVVLSVVDWLLHGYWAEGLPLLVCAGVHGILLTVWIRGRRRFRRLAVWWRWGFVAAAWGVPGACIALMYALEG